MTVLDSRIRVRGRLVRVGSLESDGIDFPANPAGFLEDVQSAADVIDVFTFVQTLPHTQPRFSYSMEWDNFAALPVSTFDDWWNRQIDRKARNMARKGAKMGLVVREAIFDDSLVKGISDIYNECPVRQGKPFWHYGKDLDTVRRENSTFLNRSMLIGAFVEGVLVGFLKLVVDRDHKQAQVMQILSMIKHRDKAPNNALIAQGVRSCADRNIPYIVYSNFSYGKKRRDSLADFKASNGFHHVEIPRYYVPLTVRGRIAMRLGLHHRLSERIPEPILARVRQARGLWYTRRRRIPTEAL
jgi:hypothetical protein